MERLKRYIPRIATFDLMRGYFMIAIIIDHLALFPNGLDWWGMRGGLFVTAAEGFFLISGIVIGIVRGAKLIDKPFRDVVRILLKRGVQLYLTLIACVLIFTFIGWFFYGQAGLKGGILPPGTNILQVIGSAISLQYYYGWADYLRLYALFLFAAPIAFWLLRRGLWYVVLLASLAVWGIFPFATASGGAEYFQPLSWQLVFFVGVTIGFYWNVFVDVWNSLRRRSKLIIETSLVTTAVVTLVASVIFMISTWGYDIGVFTAELRGSLFDMFFNKEAMPITRLILALIWFWSGFWFFKRFEKSVTKWIGWLLVPIGTNSLYAYTLHAFAVFFIHLLYVNNGVWWLNLIVTAGTILLIRLAIQYKFLMKIIPR